MARGVPRMQLNVRQCGQRGMPSDYPQPQATFKWNKIYVHHVVQEKRTHLGIRILVLSSKIDTNVNEQYTSTRITPYFPLLSLAMFFELVGILTYWSLTEYMIQDCCAQLLEPVKINCHINCMVPLLTNVYSCPFLISKPYHEPIMNEYKKRWNFIQDPFAESKETSY